MISNVKNSSFIRWFFEHDKIVVGIVIILQFCFWLQTNKFKPFLEIVPEPYSEITQQAFSLGDKQFYFRTQALFLQNLGDGYRRVTPLKDYDYPKLQKWFELLDLLDRKSHFVPAIASYYYGMSQNKEDVHYVLNYLEKHVAGQEEENWWWLVQGFYLAKYKLKDNQRALYFAKKLTSLEYIPIWARQLSALIYEDLGEINQAYEVIRYLKENIDDISPGELNFMEYFIRDRLKVIEQAQKADSKEKNNYMVR